MHPQQEFFYDEIGKELSDSFCCTPFLLGNMFTKDSQERKKKQLTIIYCEEIIEGDLRKY